MLLHIYLLSFTLKILCLRISKHVISLFFSSFQNMAENSIPFKKKTWEETKLRKWKKCHQKTCFEVPSIHHTNAHPQQFLGAKSFSFCIKHCQSLPVMCSKSNGSGKTSHALSWPYLHWSHMKSPFLHAASNMFLSKNHIFTTVSQK